MLLFALTCVPVEPVEPVYWPSFVLLGMFIILLPYLARRERACRAILDIVLLQIGVIIGTVMWGAIVFLWLDPWSLGRC
jgi:hypothetical protein